MLLQFRQQLNEREMRYDRNMTGLTSATSLAQFVHINIPGHQHNRKTKSRLNTDNKSTNKINTKYHEG